MKIALVYDRVNKWGGAERVLLTLQKIFPEATLYTSVYNAKKASWAKNFKIIPSFLQKFPLSSHHELFASLMPVAFESFSFDEFDLVISITSEAAKGILTKPTTKHICICLTPTRYLWSGYNDYFKNPILRFFATPIISYLQTWDKIASQRPDYYIAISKEVQNRIKKYYHRESTVIYPAVELTDTKIVKENKGYFLVVSRISKFTQYKKIDLAVKAATKLSLPLIVVGDGNTNKLKRIAGPTVSFVGKVTDAQLATYYANCRALVFPGIEDFGLVMVEAQAFGKPVIAFKAGGALEIIEQGKTGTFFESQTVDALAHVLANFNENVYNNKACRENALRFSFETFKKQLLEAIKK